MCSEISDIEYNRICTSLQTEEKKRRRKALEEIMDIIETHSENIEDVLKAWNILNKPVIRLLNDQTEACRDLAVEVLERFLNILPVDDKYIVYVIPVLSRRLSSQELIETSEEVRLKCILLLKFVITKYKELSSVYTDDLIGILARTVTDNYPKVKKESCECISQFAKNLSRYFYTRSETLVKPILSNFTHQHHKIRAIAVKTIGDVLQYGNSKSMEEVTTPLAERLFDQSGVVRRAVVQVGGNWLLELRDRYSWWHKILPLVMTGLHDELKEIRIEAAEFWDAAGRLYLEENQSDEKLKDKMDYLVNDPEHYPLNVIRPNLGCRIIAQQNLCKLVGGITRELGDWMPDIRVRSAQLLCVLVLNVEEGVTQHIEKLLPAMHRACNDEDKRVVENIEVASEYLGYFVDPNIYCRLVLPTIEDCPTAGHFRVLAAIIKGSDRKPLSSRLEDIGHFLQQPDICQSNKRIYQEQILSCCNSVLLVAKEDCKIISQDLFTIIFTVLSMATEDTVHKEAHRLLDTLAEINSMKNIKEVYCSYIKPVIVHISRTCKSWTLYDAESQIFRGTLIYGGIATIQNMDNILYILKETTNINADPELRLKHFILLSEFFSSNQELFQYVKDLNSFIEGILDDCILPGLIWHAGRTAEALRTAAVSCLCSFLECNAIFSINKGSQEYFEKKAFEKIISILVTLVDDNAKKTRLHSLRAIYLTMKIGQVTSCIKEDHIHQMYPAALKRLDDACDDIRCAAIETLVIIWNNIPKEYDRIFSKTHIDLLYTTAVIHLDDPETKFQDLMLDALKNLANVHPELLYQKLQNCRTNFRNQVGIDKLLQHCQDILKSI